MLMCEPARRQAVTNPDKHHKAIKRSMGTVAKVKVQGKEYTPQGDLCIHTPED